jgi:hypothetical protein
MLHPGIAYDIVSGQRKAMIAQAATAARVRAAQRAIGVTVRNVSPAANEHDRDGQTGKSPMT